ncbi:MAG: salicylaldehyde dehydrogenase [Proteobacteria bacterium]|nr:MAG: salicylaldehyde dehydrogenase [Pseudomonadota bacterium]
MQTVQLLIGDSDRPASGAATFVRANPLTGEVATTAAAASPDDARAAAEAAAAAFPKWSALGPNARRALLNKAADLLAARAEEFATLMMAETGATAAWGHFNVQLAAGMLREAAALTTQVTGEVVPSDVPGSLAMAIRQPVGVVLGIAPWNAPVILGVRAIATPLACGNTVILKASEVCPATHRLIGTVLREAGLGDGVVNVITHDPKDAGAVSEALIGHPAVRRVNFTGSTRVGKLIAQTAAKYLKPVLLELGGKAPLIVLEDADLDAAVNATVFGAYANSGQICMSTERVIVHEAVADEFAARLVRRVAELPAGDPRQGPVVLGSVVDRTTVERVQQLVEDAVSQGAKVLTGGTAEGTVMQGIVVDHVTPAMRLFREESFGPQVSITRVKSADEAVQLANDTEYGLSAAIFSRDIAKALELAKRIDSGICHINGPTVHDEAQMPFGGVKASGYGRFGGKAGVAEFTELRWITIQTGPRQYPF